MGYIKIMLIGGGYVYSKRKNGFRFGDNAKFNGNINPFYNGPAKTGRENPIAGKFDKEKLVIEKGETQYDLSKIGKHEYLGRHVRVESDNSVHFDTGVGKVIRQAIGKFTGHKPVYVKDLGTKINILNHATSSGEERVVDVSKILAKSIVRNHTHNTLSNASNAKEINPESLNMISKEEHKLLHRLRKDPIINTLINNIEKDNIKYSKTLSVSDILSELENQGVDLKKRGIDVDKFVDILADKISKKHVVNKDLIKMFIKDKYDEIRALESDPRAGPNEIKFRCNELFESEVWIEPQNALLGKLFSRPGASVLIKHFAPPLNLSITEDKNKLLVKLESCGVDLKKGTINIDKFAEFRYDELLAKNKSLPDFGLKESCIQGIKKRCMEVKDYESSILANSEKVKELYENLLKQNENFFLNF